jgi:hypothetical protein
MNAGCRSKRSDHCASSSRQECRYPVAHVLQQPCASVATIVHVSRGPKRWPSTAIAPRLEPCHRTTTIRAPCRPWALAAKIAVRALATRVFSTCTTMRSIAIGWTCKRGRIDKRGGRKVCRDGLARNPYGARRVAIQRKEQTVLWSAMCYYAGAGGLEFWHSSLSDRSHVCE